MSIRASTIPEIVQANVARESKLYTDESLLYRKVGAHFGEHGTVKHSAGEYARGVIYTNKIEGYFSIFKRGMKGIYRHCRKKYLQRYLAKFDFRYNHRIAAGCGDYERSCRLIEGMAGKRLTYRRTDGAERYLHG